MTLSEVAKKLGLDAEEVFSRARLLKLNPNNIKESDLERIKNYAPMTVSDRKPESQTDKPKPTAKSGDTKLTDVLSETNKAIQAAKQAGEHLDAEFIAQQQQAGLAIGTLAGLARGTAIAQKTIEVDNKIYRALIEDSHERISGVAQLALGGGEVPKLYHDSTQIQSNNYELPITIG